MITTSSRTGSKKPSGLILLPMGILEIHDGQSDGVIAPKVFGMISGCDSEDAIEEGAAKIYNLITWYAEDKGSQYCRSGRETSFQMVCLIADSRMLCLHLFLVDYTPLSDHIDWMNHKLSYGTKLSTYADSNYVSNDFVSCDNSDKSSEVNTNDFASSDSSVKSSEPKSNDSTSCASTSSVSTSESEAEIESNVGTPIQEPIIVQDLPSFSCNSFDKNENTSRTSCNKNGYFNKKAGHFRKNASSVSKLCFENPYSDAEDEGIFDSGCSRSMTGTNSKTPTLDFENVYYGKDGNNSYSRAAISQICDKKNRVLFTDTDCLVLSKDFMLPDESMVGSHRYPSYIDETPYTITEDSVRSQLQLADDGGIDDLPIAEIYYGMDNLSWSRKVKQWVKLKTKKRKVVVSDSDQEEGGEQDVDLDALLALANAAVIVDSNIPPGGASSSHIPTDIPPGGASSSHISTDVPTGVAPAGVSNKGKTSMVEEDITVKERTLKQIEDDRLGEEAAKRLHDEEQAQVEANASFSKTLLGDDVTEDNFPVRMAALIKRKKQALDEKLAKERMERPMTPTKAKVESFTDAQLTKEFEKIQKALNKSLRFKTLAGLERTDLGFHTPIPSVPDVPQPPVGSSPKSSGTRRKSLSRNHEAPILGCFCWLGGVLYSSEKLMLLQVLIDSQEGGKGSFVWNHQSLWQIRSWRLYTLSNVHVLETVSGEVLYMFADVSYPLSVKLMERMLKHKLEIDKDVVGNDMTTAEQLIRFIKNQIAAAQFNKATDISHYMVLEGVLMKNQDAAVSRDIHTIQVKPQADWMLLQSSYFNPQVSTSRYVVPTGRVVVPTGRYVVPAGKVIIIVSPGRLSLVPTGRILSPGRVK
ncbi:hypothetical protein Tco_0514824 [Tanacetum coccineum]